ncbi:hypothetical protein KRX51_01535 [Corynebacterium sp. TAE3-ERU12]|uniref:hypothetical protein n=1 Tax=Corynebacterium sp. TAE3-ERU12 TaxID=2849491 RepID=UPI001C45A858|nr:hypothetical protein [Corynebacterium sp. TAE3-ERU12]MBV7294598.1 hypothetical protein [Corynebacterium sp. TAE3-ERU12]
MAEVNVSAGDGPGVTRINTRALDRLARAAIASVPGTIVESKGGGINWFGTDLPKIDISADATGAVVTVEARIAVRWPCPVGRVAQSVRDSIITWFDEGAGVRANCVNVQVEAARPTAGYVPVSREQLDARSNSPDFEQPHIPAHPEMHPPAPPAARTIRHPDIRSVAVTHPVTIPEHAPLKQVTVLSQQPARSVSAPAPVEVRKPEVISHRTVDSVSAPAADDLRSPQIHRREAKSVSAAKPVEVYSPTVPAPRALRSPEIIPGRRVSQNYNQRAAQSEEV